jgi:CheY-like chemotaxis protein/Tfp pilus assembly protein PilF
MTLQYISNSDQLLDYGSLRALVVDDIPSMRSALKMTLANFGVSHIDVASSAQEVIFRLSNGQYDVILADYNLGESRDGQQLLEELRHRGLIGLETAYVMVTAESVYEKVVATAELAPDDYMIKPFSAEALRNRLDQILQRKLVFAPVYRRFADGDLEAAAAGCDELIRAKPRYLVDALRLKGELLNALGRFDESEALYRKVIEMRAVPWARLGLARALHQQGREEEAEEILQDLLTASPELVAAYDLLADVRLGRKDGKGAQEALQKGTAISAKTVRRQQRLGEVAYDNQDLDTAREAYSAALDKGRHSIFVTHQDYGNLCRVQVEQGDLTAAIDTLKKGKPVLQTSAEGQLVSAVVQSIVHTKAGQPEAAKKALEEADRLRKEGARGDGNLMLDLAGTYMAQGRGEEADAIVGEVAKNAHDSEALLAKAKRIYTETGREDAGNKLLSEATANVRRLNNEGVLLAQKGDYAVAVERLFTACREAPYNPRVLMNAAWVAMKYIDQEGMEQEVLAQTKRLIEQAEQLAPGHGRIPGLRNRLREIQARFGIRRR